VGSSRCRSIYLATLISNNRQTSMPPARFEPAIPASERTQSQTLGFAATVKLASHIFRLPPPPSCPCRFTKSKKPNAPDRRTELIIKLCSCNFLALPLPPGRHVRTFLLISLFSCIIYSEKRSFNC